MSKLEFKYDSGDREEFKFKTIFNSVSYMKGSKMASCLIIPGIMETLL